MAYFGELRSGKVGLRPLSRARQTCGGGIEDYVQQLNRHFTHNPKAITLLP